MENEDENEENILRGHSSQRLDYRKAVVIKMGTFQKPIVFYNTVLNEESGASLYCDVRHEKEMFEALFEHFSALFRLSSPSISVSFNSVTDFENPIKVPGIAHTYLVKGTVDANILDEHFKKYPNQISTCIDAEITGQFSEDSAILNVSDIYSESPSPISLFKLFNGRNLQLLKCNFDTNDIVEFLEKWTSGDSHQNLELLYLSSAVARGIDKRAIIQQLGLTLWPENTPYMFEHESSADRAKKGNKLVIDCRQYYQVERASDRKLAAFNVHEDAMLFCVFQ